MSSRGIKSLQGQRQGDILQAPLSTALYKHCRPGDCLQPVWLGKTNTNEASSLLNLSLKLYNCESFFLLKLHRKRQQQCRKVECERTRQVHTLKWTNTHTNEYACCMPPRPRHTREQDTELESQEEENTAWGFPISCKLTVIIATQHWMILLHTVSHCYYSTQSLPQAAQRRNASSVDYSV